MIEKTFNTGEINLNYMEGTPNGSPLLLLHALASKWQSFYYLIPELERTCHIHALDLRGHGKSDRASSYKIQDYIPDVTSYIRNKILEPTVVFGHSQGGMIGIMVAAYFPELVKGLIVGDSVISLEFLKQFSDNNKNTTIFWRDLARSDSYEYIISKLKDQLIPVPNKDELVPAYKVMGDNNPYFQFLASTLSQLDHEILTADIEYFNETYCEYITENLFPKIKCPVLLIQGNQQLGSLMRDEDVERALNLIPNSTHVKLNTVGHFIMEDKESVINAIVPFVKSI